MKTRIAIVGALTALHLLAVLAVPPAGAAPAAGPVGRDLTSLSAVHHGGTQAKADTDTIVLMGPGGSYPYRGDFETAWAKPAGDGLLTEGWTSVDETAPGDHWHVDSHDNPFVGLAAWCGSLALASCGVGDPDGGYGNDWYEILEFRKAVPGAATVRVQADIQYDTEPAYDFVRLQRRTLASPDFEPVHVGQGLMWDGDGIAAVDYTFTYTAAERVGGTDIAVAFVFDSDAAWSDEDCLWTTTGAVRVDNVRVTVNGTAYDEDFEDGELGPDWATVPVVGVGDFARVWNLLGDLDPCASNYTNQVAFIDDGLTVPGLPGTFGLPGNDYGPPGGYVVNSTGGLSGPAGHLHNAVRSPVMAWPDAAMDGMVFAFDVYRHELLIPNDTPGIFYYWSVRSTAGGDISAAPWRDRNYVYHGGPDYTRALNVVDDLIEAGATQVQVTLGVVELGWQFGYGAGTNSSPAPYFDNVNVKVYRSPGPRMVALESNLANDGFPAAGVLDLADLGANSVRFDMAASIAPGYLGTNDPGDSVCVDISPRSGGSLDPPALHWSLAVRNPLFDPYRDLPPNPVVGRPTRTAGGVLVANRWNFDLPDTGMLFPGDVLHYYFAATDHVAGDTRTATLPQDVAGFGQPHLGAYPDVFTVRCLPGFDGGYNRQPPLLVWNDGGFGEEWEAWLAAMAATGKLVGLDFDIYSTHAPDSGVGNGLGGRATVALLDGYDAIAYTAGNLGSPTLSNGDANRDPGDDLALLGGWLDQGDRGLLLAGDDLALSLHTSGTAGRAFLESRLGVSYLGPDVRDHIGGQVAPLVVATTASPHFSGMAPWRAYGGCPRINDFDRVAPLGGALRVAQYTAPDGVSTPYTAAAAIFNESGSDRFLFLPYDLAYVNPAGAGTPASVRAELLCRVFEPLGVWCISIGGTDLPTAAAVLSVSAQPNPFNPAVELRYTLARPGHLAMKVFDTRGALVRTLSDGHVATASGVIVWDGADDRGGQAASGLYFVETRAEGQVDVRKVTMLK
ncbi:MAG: hypothetical protein IPK64_15195 [bacterium]|nr:hypothetical protein [bacterium]